MEQKNKMGRPPIQDPAMKRNQYVCTPMTKDEKEVLVKFSKELDINLSTLMRTIIFTTIESYKQSITKQGE